MEQTGYEKTNVKSKSKSKNKGINQKNEREQRYLFSIKTDIRHDENKKRMGYMKKDDKKRQKFRKKEFKVSNPLGNYYFPKLHERSWFPNGVYTVKRRYNETEIGLEHFYEKNNVEQLEDNPPKGEKKKDNEFLQNFIEYKELKKGKYVITIEYCASCDEHSNITQHSDEVFKNLALDYQKIIQERFPFIQVLLKPIDVDIIKTEGFKLPDLPPNGKPYDRFPKVNDQFKQCRIGAFEIQICSKDSKGGEDIKIIHSKLKSKTFPKVNQVLEKIVSYMPKFSLELILYDKEDYDDIEKMNDIQVNIYYYKSEIIKEISDDAEMEILNFTNPKNRLEKMRITRTMNKENAFKDETFSNNTQRLNSATMTSFRAKTTTGFRPRSQYTGYNNMYNTTENDLSKQKGKLIQRRFSRIDEFKYQEPSQVENKDDKKIIKGSKVQEKEEKKEESNLDHEEENEVDDRSESVLVKFNPLPYDTYLIETIENSNFSPSLTLLKFDTLPEDEESLNTVKKFIGLMHQTRSIFLVHVWIEEVRKVPINNGKQNNQNQQNENQKNENGNPQEYALEYDQIPINSANITICKIENPNSKYEIKLNSQKIYEYKTDPGEYKIVIENKDCETLQMKVKLEKGLNEKNFKLQPQKACDLTLRVKEYYQNEEEDTEEGTNVENQNEEIEIRPVRNAEVKIFKNPDILLIEGITNRNGLMKYEIGKDDNSLSIVVNKFGYFPAQRYFTRNEDIEIENGKYIVNMTIILIKQSLLTKSKKVLFISYANTNKKLFSFQYSNIDENNNKIIQKDFQEEDGIFIGLFHYIKKDNEEDEEGNGDGKRNDENSQLNSINISTIPQNANNEEFDEETNYEEIIRIGMKVTPKSIQSSVKKKKKGEEEKEEDEKNKNDENIKEMTVDDIIEYLRKVCCQALVYTPKNTFSINLPKVLNRPEEDENLDKRNKNKKNKEKKRNENAILPSNGLYWDIGWIDAKNTLFYETSLYNDIDKVFDRVLYFEPFIEFLQIFIDKKIYDTLFEQFGFNESVLTGTDRYLPKVTFVNQCNNMLTDKIEGVNNYEQSPERKKQLEEQKKKRKEFIEFLSNIMCGYDDENNILDDSISLYLLKKKISSNLSNFEDSKQGDSGKEDNMNGY